MVSGIQKDHFEIGGVNVPGSVIVFPFQFFSWDIQKAEDIRPCNFDILEFIKPKPSYIVIGTGGNKVFLEDDVMAKLDSFGVRFDVLDTFQAVSTYNISSEDDMNIVAFFLPGKLDEFDFHKKQKSGALENYNEHDIIV